MRLVFVFFALLLSLHAAPVIAQKKTAKAAVKRNYIRRDLSLAFNRPATWLEFSKTPEPNLVVGFQSTVEERFSDRLVARGIITVSVQKAPGPVLPPNYAETLDADYKKRDPNYTLSGTARFKVAGEPAVSIAFQSREPVIGAIARSRQVWVVRNKRLYLFTLTARLEDFDRYVEDFDKMMASIQWLPAK